MIGLFRGFMRLLRRRQLRLKTLGLLGSLLRLLRQVFAQHGELLFDRVFSRDLSLEFFLRRRQLRLKMIGLFRGFMRLLRRRQLRLKTLGLLGSLLRLLRQVFAQHGELLFDRVFSRDLSLEFFLRRRQLRLGDARPPQ